jgi:methionine sulfoxide reductase heme-binding subunit
MTGTKLLIAITVVIGTMCAGLLATTGDPRDVVIWTARTSFVLFVLAYLARPATVLWPSAVTKRLLRERKWIGDGFAVSHLYHLAAIIAVAAGGWDAFMAERDGGTLLAIAGYLLLFAMAITSIDRVRAAMSRRAWNALHRTGMHVLWIVFMGSYVKRFSTSGVAAAAVTVLAVIAGVRAAAWLRARSKARARASVAA